MAVAKREVPAVERGASRLHVRSLMQTPGIIRENGIHDRQGGDVRCKNFTTKSASLIIARFAWARELPAVFIAHTAKLPEVNKRRAHNTDSIRQLLLKQRSFIYIYDISNVDSGRFIGWRELFKLRSSKINHHETLCNRCINNSPLPKTTSEITTSKCLRVIIPISISTLT
jgi:hypothetical protein